MGNIMLLTRKSSKSKMVLPCPRGWNADHRLNPKTQGRDKAVIAIKFARQDCFLLQCNKSMPQELMFSNTASMVENAAKVIKTKKSVPQIWPPAIPLNTLGNVMKIRLGPLSGLMPKEKQVGKIISPETNATKVSNMAMFMDSPKRLRLLSM